MVWERVDIRALSQVHPVIGFADKDILLKLKPGVRGSPHMASLTTRSIEYVERSSHKSRVLTVLVVVGWVQRGCLGPPEL